MLRLSFERSLRKGTYRHNAIVAVHMPCIFCSIKPTARTVKHTTTRKTATHERTPDKPHVHSFTRTHHAYTHLAFSVHSQSAVISRSHPALTPPPSLRPAPPLPVKHKYRVLAPGGYSIIASEVILSHTEQGGPCRFLPRTARAGLC